MNTRLRILTATRMGRYLFAAALAVAPAAVQSGATWLPNGTNFASGAADLPLQLAVSLAGRPAAG